MISFDNTEIAFQGKTKKDLNRAYWLFKLDGILNEITTEFKVSCFILDTERE